MTQVDPAYILKLVEASEALDNAKKAEIRDRLGSLSLTQLGEIQNALEEEQKFNAEHYRKIGQIKIASAEKKIKKIYQHAEATLEKSEAKDIALLENQLAQIET